MLYPSRFTEAVRLVSISAKHGGGFKMLNLPVTARGSIIRDAAGARVCAVEHKDPQQAFDNATEIAKRINAYEGLVMALKLFINPTHGSKSGAGDTSIGWSPGMIEASERVRVARAALRYLDELQ